MLLASDGDVMTAESPLSATVTVRASLRVSLPAWSTATATTSSVPLTPPTTAR